MKLLIWENYNLTITEEAMFIKSLRVLWKRDKSSGKEKALRDLSFVYFMCDPRSPYMYIVDTDERSQLIKEQEGITKWKPDKEVLRAMEVYKKLCTTTSSILLESTRKAIDKVRLFLEELDLTEEDEKRKPKYTISSVTSALKDIPKLISQLNDCEKTLNSELEDATRMRGIGEKKLFEDGFKL